MIDGDAGLGAARSRRRAGCRPWLRITVLDGKPSGVWGPPREPRRGHLYVDTLLPKEKQIKKNLE